MGPAAATYQHGRRSRYAKLFTAETAAIFKRVANDEDPLSVGPEIEVIQTRIEQAITRLKGHDSAALWRDLSSTVTEMNAAKRYGNGDALTKAIDKMADLIRLGAHEERQWDEVVKLIERKARVAGMEAKRQAEAQQTLAGNKALLMFGTVVDIFLRILDGLAGDGCPPALLVGARRRLVLEVNAIAGPAAAQEKVDGAQPGNGRATDMGPDPTQGGAAGGGAGPGHPEGAE